MRAHTLTSCARNQVWGVKTSISGATVSREDPGDVVTVTSAVGGDVKFRKYEADAWQAPAALMTTSTGVLESAMPAASDGPGLGTGVGTALGAG